MVNLRRKSWSMNACPSIVTSASTWGMAWRIVGKEPLKEKPQAAAQLLKIYEIVELEKRERGCDGRPMEQAHDLNPKMKQVGGTSAEASHGEGI